MKLSAEQVHQFLVQERGAHIEDVIPVGQGEWSSAYFFKENGIDKVLRLSPLSDDFLCDQFAADNFNAAHLPIPPIEVLGKWNGGYYAISPRIAGKMLDDLEASQMHHTLPAILNLFEALRLANTSKTSGFGGWDAAGNGASQSWKEVLLGVNTDSPGSRIYGWKENLSSQKKACRTFELGYLKMEKLAPFCPEERHLIHADLLHFNVLTDSGKVVAVLDWGCAKYGDFLYDIAWFDFWQFYYPAMKGLNFPEAVQNHYAHMRLQVPEFEKRLRCYELHIALDSLAYLSFKKNWKNLQMTVERMEPLL